ncbi:MAG: helix-turn-helix domain-containing protein [Armatimonadota bacterium]|nr:helix-turn-helix domain-containing protein [Armatimonadota bacterium]
MLQPILSVKEAASYLKVQPRTIRDWIAAGRLMARKVGKSYIIAEEEVGKMVTTIKRPKHTTFGDEERRARSVEFRALLRGGRQIDKDSVRTEWDQDPDYEKRIGEPK